MASCSGLPPQADAEPIKCRTGSVSFLLPNIPVESGNVAES